MTRCKRCDELMTMDKPCGSCGWTWATEVKPSDLELSGEINPSSLTVQATALQEAIDILGGVYASADQSLILMKEKLRRILASSQAVNDLFNKGYLLTLTIAVLPKSDANV